MGSKWAIVSIDDIKLPEKYSCVGGPFGSSLSQKHYVDSGVPVIRGTNLAGDIFSESGFVFVSPDKANELQRNMAFRGDIVFTQRGTLGQVALIPEDSIYERYIVSQSQMKLTVNPKHADAYFIYTYFRTNEAKALIENNAIIGGVPHINLGILKQFKLRLPPLSEQKRISEVSKSIDNKINLNYQINQTLEQMSQTLFKSWFVDFDPVIDNALDAGKSIPEALQSRAELRQKVRNSADFKPLPADIRALFPAEFEETEMGWLPTEWKNGNLSDVTKILSGFAFKSKDFGDNGKNVIKIKNITSAKTIDVDDTQKISEFIAKDANRFLLFDGDILMAMTGATVGKFGVLTTKNNEEYYLNQRVAKFETENKAYLYCVLNQESTDRFITNAAQGSAQPNISAKDILSMPLLIPSVELINTFNDFISHIFYRMITNTKANLNLTALRDTLLPKLISGELSLEDLPDLIKQTEAA